MKAVSCSLEPELPLRCLASEGSLWLAVVLWQCPSRVTAWLREFKAADRVDDTRAAQGDHHRQLENVLLRWVSMTEIERAAQVSALGFREPGWQTGTPVCQLSHSTVDIRTQLRVNGAGTPPSASTLLHVGMCTQQQHRDPSRPSDKTPLNAPDLGASQRRAVDFAA